MGKKGEQAYREGSSWTKHARGYTKKRLVSRLTLDKPNKIGYNKVIEYNGRKANLELDYKGRLIPHEMHDIGTKIRITPIAQPNKVILKKSGSSKENVQDNFYIYDEEGKMLLQLHYGHHGTPKRHNFGTKEKPEYIHKHIVSFDEGGLMSVGDGEKMSIEEGRYRGYENHKK